MVLLLPYLCLSNPICGNQTFPNGEGANTSNLYYVENLQIRIVATPDQVTYNGLDIYDSLAGIFSTLFFAATGFSDMNNYDYDKVIETPKLSLFESNDFFAYNSWVHVWSDILDVNDYITAYNVIINNIVTQQCIQVQHLPNGNTEYKVSGAVIRVDTPKYINNNINEGIIGIHRATLYFGNVYPNKTHIREIYT